MPAYSSSGVLMATSAVLQERVKNDKLPYSSKAVPGRAAYQVCLLALLNSWVS